MRVDILNLEWTSFSSRDRDSSTLVCNYLRYQGLTVIEGSVFNGYYLIRKYKPRAIFMSNTTGSSLNQKVSRYAKKHGSLVFTTISEGNLKEELVDEMVWGHNKERVAFEDLLLLWSKQSASIVVQHFPILQKIIKIGGSAGHDKYFIRNVEGVCTPANKKLVVGVGCWSFEYFMEDSIYQSTYSQEINDFFNDQRNKFDHILSEFIRNNPDCHFILKEHPSIILRYLGSGIESCISLPNVSVYKNEIPIEECICQSSLWISYDSTTGLEAWLLEKQSCLLNPEKAKWPIPRDQLHSGQPIFGCLEELEAALQRIKQNKQIHGFQELSNQRKEIINGVIEWADGLNHVRIGNALIEILSTKMAFKPIDPKLAVPGLWDICKQRIRWKLVQYFSSYFTEKAQESVRVTMWSQKQLDALASDRMRQQLDYYEKMGLGIEELKDIRAI